MPASLTFPPGAPSFRSGLNPREVGWRIRPPEGDRSAAANIAWGVDDVDPGGTAIGALQFNLSSVSTAEFSQIAALYVDNLQSGADVDFIFQDTQFRLTVPAGSQGLYPIISKSRQFVAVAAMAILGDATYVQILNSLPPPVAIEKSVFMSVALVSGVSIAASLSTPIVAAGTTGTMTGALAIISNAAASGGGNALVGVELQDGNANTLVASAFGLQSGGFVPSTIVIDLSAVNVRFEDGINLVLTKSGGATIAGSVIVNFYYRTP